MLLWPAPLSVLSNATGDGVDEVVARARRRRGGRWREIALHETLAVAGRPATLRRVFSVEGAPDRRGAYIFTQRCRVLSR